LDGHGNKTGQLEIIILRDDASSLGMGEADTFLAEGVFAVIEVKSTLTREKLQEALETLKKVRTLNLAPSTNLIIQSFVTLYRPLCCVFAYEGATLDTLVGELEKKENQDIVDLICVLNRGAIIPRSHLLQWEGNSPYYCCLGKAGALGWLYFHLVSYAAGFVTRDLSLLNYFGPLNGWGETAE
jgi:hypothetical protein